MTFLHNIGEEKLLRAVKTWCGKSSVSPSLMVGIGDDAAVFQAENGIAVLVTTDMLIEHVHFLPGFPSYVDLGYKSLAVNLSDIAAMGGTPKFAFFSLGFPKTMMEESISQFYEGALQLAGETEVAIVGGDTCLSPNGIIISVTLTGECPLDEVILRSGAEVGDKILVSGKLGDSAAGMELYRSPIPVEEHIESILLGAHCRPYPKIQEGRLLASSGLVNAMIDLSDGLSTDIRHLCNAGGVGACIYAKDLPLSNELRIFCNALNCSPMKYALHGGEDYGLMFTVPEKNVSDLLEEFHRHRLAEPFVIGEITENQKIVLISNSGKPKPLDQGGFSHFGELPEQE